MKNIIELAVYLQNSSKSHGKKSVYTMGCSPSNIETPESRSKLTIWGDYFNQDTRAILAICAMAGLDADFKLVDTFEQ